jgi:hypothetical protein
MRDSKSTPKRKVGREPPQRLSASCWRKITDGGQEAKRPSSQPGEGTAWIKNPLPGRAHRAAMAVTFINLRLAGGGRQAPLTMRHNAEEPHTLFRERLPPASLSRESG